MESGGKYSYGICAGTSEDADFSRKTAHKSAKAGFFKEDCEEAGQKRNFSRKTAKEQGRSMIVQEKCVWRKAAGCMAYQKRRNNSRTEAARQGMAAKNQRKAAAL